VEPIRTLILSGGGGRGAFHAGVYKYLMQSEKKSVSSEHQGAWQPDIVVGTSIGAVNGAAIVQGVSPHDLERTWLSLREHDIQGLPPGMKGLSRWIANAAMRQIIGVPLPGVPANQATSPVPSKYWSPLPLLPTWLADRLIGRWINLLDTGPLKRTLHEKLHFNPQAIAASSQTLMITATNVQTGERMIFSNKPIHQRANLEPRQDVAVGITADRVLASCSIPLVYPWTFDPETKAYYWDGAVVANTPLGVALDAAQNHPVDVPMEIVVVMMTPWWEPGETVPLRARELPGSFNEAITWTLDWALLSSFRDRLHVIEFYNQLASQERAEGRTPLNYRQVKVVIVAPKEFFPAARIIDYDAESESLISQGYAAAEAAFQKNWALG
jgi:NTE family protein